LPNLREIQSYHIAFKSITKLEQQALDYNLEIIFVPKFHCELNLIEGFGCFMKQYVRKRNDQNIATMHQLIIEGIGIYQKDPELVNLNLKLWHRFWCCVDMHKDG